MNQLLRPRRALPAAAVASALLALPALAHAGPPGKWSKVTGPNRNIDEIGLARTPNGVLHVLWPRDRSVLHSSISSNARGVRGPNRVFTYPNGLNKSVALIRSGAGLRAFFSGVFDTTTAPLTGLMATATSGDGTSWALQPTPASNNSQAGRSAVSAASGIGAVAGPGGVPISTWGDSAPGENGFHAGLAFTGQDVRFASACCVYGPNIGVDSATGRTILAWKLAGATDGTFVKSLTPPGPNQAPPGGRSVDASTRVGITGRSAGRSGVFLAYQRGTNQFRSRPAVWRVGAARARTLTGVRGARSIGISPAPGGRLWVFWYRGKRVFAVRSNKSATAWGAIVSRRAPRGTDTLYRVFGDGTRGSLDLLALARRSASDLGYWHQRIRPGLTLRVRKHGGSVTLRVRDAGSRVRGATVRLRKRGGGTAKATTGNSGNVTLGTSGAGRYRATATKAGYVKATRRFRVK
jgi:hypothetical protein